MLSVPFSTTVFTRESRPSPSKGREPGPRGRSGSSTMVTRSLATRVPSRPDYQNYAHETLLRSDHRLLLVQIVHGDNIDSTSDEMVAALKSLTVY